MSGNRRLTSIAAVVSIVLLVLCLSQAEGNAIKRLIREAKEPKSTSAPSFCHRSTPCGWSVYTPYTKKIDYFMPNTCLCREGLDCIRIENDLSISAYVHMCREKSEAPEKIL